MQSISLDDYWEKLADYYYDNVHYEHPSHRYLKDWVESTFDCIVNRSERTITFQDPKKFTLFALKWS